MARRGRLCSVFIPAIMALGLLAACDGQKAVGVAPDTAARPTPRPSEHRATASAARRGQDGADGAGAGKGAIGADAPPGAVIATLPSGVARARDQRAAARRQPADPVAAGPVPPPGTPAETGAQTRAVAGTAATQTVLNAATETGENPDAALGTLISQARRARAARPARAGEIEVLEPDGSVTTLQSPGANAVVVARAGVIRAPGEREGGGMTASGSLLPSSGPVDPAQLIGAAVAVLPGDRVGNLVEATVNVRDGVDGDTAFAYATCALSGWARANGFGYARHIRTLQDEGGGRLRMASVFTVSKDEPAGLRVIVTRDAITECRGRGFPVS